MKIIKLGSNNGTVQKIQQFLTGQGLPLEADGDFGIQTEKAVKAWQLRNNLKADGLVGNMTLAAMLAAGMALMPEPEVILTPSISTKPPFPPLISTADRQKMFGAFNYAPSPSADNPERIRIEGDWESQNIELFELPQLRNIKLSTTGNIRFHKKAKAQLLGLWQAWEDADLLKHVRSYEGAYVPRFIRGSRTTLSNHAFGTAFDINYTGNELGRTPAPLGSTNSVRELVPLAHEFGFYWGGNFSRADGMHFEVAKILKVR